jgi:lipopolysaccharide transport system ATP-binding protein
MPTAIRIENVSKLYRLGTVTTGTLAHDINRWWHVIRGKDDPYSKIGQVNDRTKYKRADVLDASDSNPDTYLNGKKSESLSNSDYVWALKDISFDVEQGEIIGIIGRNGAGKSTLLKLLSRVTAPTTGSIRSKGRIASLLEVGTGFHPELTGRENIYMNGAILGMRRHEITKLFDDIVDFSGCGRYIDTPVKRYSSGMSVRLGFSVAAHLRCEVMIVDEVLAVGDADFQQKCLGKMRSMHDTGRTVLVVSHHMSMITAICDRGIVLNQGTVEFDGTAEDAVMHYLPGSRENGAIYDVADGTSRIGDDRATLQKAWLESSDGVQRRIFDIGEPIIIKMQYELLRDDIPWPYANYHIFDEMGNYVFVTAGKNYPDSSAVAQLGVFISECTIPADFLNTGTFTIGVALTSMDRGTNVCFWEPDALKLQVTEKLDKTLYEKRYGYAGPIPGPIRPQLQWNIIRCNNIV